MPTKIERRKWGALGGKARAAKLSSKRRVQIARRAAFTRWFREESKTDALVQEFLGGPQEPLVP